MSIRELSHELHDIVIIETIDPTREDTQPDEIPHARVDDPWRKIVMIKANTSIQVGFDLALKNIAQETYRHELAEDGTTSGHRGDL